MPSSGARLPLYARDGEVRAVALVDETDLADLSRWRWSLHSAGYACRSERIGPGRGRKRLVLLHRYLLGLTEGDGQVADHINRDRLDCRRENLRVTTRQGNAENQGSRGGVSPYRGVTRAHDMWRAQAVINGRHISLGLFESEDGAGEAAAKFRSEHMPLSEDARKVTT